MKQSYPESSRYDLPGARKFLPSDREDAKTYPGVVIDAYVPNVAREPIYSFHEDAKHPFGAPRTPVDYAVGMQMSAEVKMILNYWDIDRLEGRIVICPMRDRDHEFLHKLIEAAYAVEGVVSGVQQRVKEVSSFVKAVWSAL